MRTQLLLLSWFCATTTVATSQSTAVLPTGQRYDSARGDSGLSLPFSGLYGRAMEVYRDRATGMTKATIDEVAWRRDGRFTSYVPGRRNVTVRFGHTKTAPENLPTAFDQVSSDLTQVFQGTVQLPRADRSNTTAPHPFRIVIKLQRPWVYQRTSGHLVIDVEAETNVNSTWIRDARYVSASGRAGSFRALGNGCTLSNQRQLRTSPAVSTLIPGRAMRLAVTGGPQAMLAAANFLGVRNRNPFPIDLTSLGAPGCRLYTEPSLLAVVPLRWDARSGASGAIEWQIPALASLNGARVNTQWVGPDTVNRLGLGFSNGVEVTLGSVGRPWLVQAIVSSRKGSRTGLLTGEQAGIVRLGYR